MEDFERLLDTVKKPREVNSNFAVLDAKGGCAYYETGNYEYVKFDVNDVNVMINVMLGKATEPNADLTGDGTVCNGSVTLAGALTPQDGIPTVDGDFATAPTACVDFGCTDGDMVALGSKHLVLRVTGTVDANAKFKAVNCGQPCSLTASVEDGLVYVHVKSGGTVLLFR